MSALLSSKKCGCKRHTCVKVKRRSHVRAILPDCRGIMQMSLSVLVLQCSLQRGTDVLRPGGQSNNGLDGAISLYRLNRDSRQLVRCACLHLKVGDMTPTPRDQKYKHKKGGFLIACSQNMEKSGLWKIVSSEL